MMICVCLSSGFQVNKSKPPLLTSYAFDSEQLRRCNDLSQVSRKNELFTGIYDVNEER